MNEEIYVLEGTNANNLHGTSSIQASSKVAPTFSPTHSPNHASTNAPLKQQNDGLINLFTLPQSIIYCVVGFIVIVNCRVVLEHVVIKEESV